MRAPRDGPHNSLACHVPAAVPFIVNIFMPPQPMLHRRHYVFVLFVAASVPSSDRPVFRPVPNMFLSLRRTTERISIKFAGGNHYHEQIRLNCYILGEIRTWTREQDATEYSNGRQLMLPQC